jgi:chorismate dehydratase
MPDLDHQKSQPIRIGSVSYTNSLPLIYGLDDTQKQRELGYTLVEDVPSEIARQFADGKLDVALLPAFEFFNQNNSKIINAGCIACMGEVLSVRIFSRCDIREVKTLALDPASRTSNSLTRILAKHLWRIEPEFIAPDTAANRSKDADARLIIGDPALQQLGQFPFEYDLGAAWHELTQLPFVFAVWVIRNGVDAPTISDLLRDCKTNGLVARDDIARKASTDLGLAESLVSRYLNQHIKYELGTMESVALEMYYRMLRDEGMVEPVDGLQYYSVQTASSAATQ